MIRFSLTTLFVVVLFAAIGCAAFVNANDLWRQTIVTATVAALVIATLAAVVRQSQSRVFALGFAVTGWIYLVLVFVSAFGLRDDLLTDKAVTGLFATIHGEQASQQQSVRTVAFPPVGTRVAAGETIMKLWDVSTGQAVSANAGGQKVELKNFADIGHSLWVIIVACLGGVVARVLAGVKWQERETPSASGKVGD